MKIVVKEIQYAGHFTTAEHVYNISESLKSVNYDASEHELKVEFGSYEDILTLHVDQLVSLEIEY